MVKPDFARSQRPRCGEMLFRDDIAAIWAPAGLVEQTDFFLGDLSFVTAVAVHDPDIVATAAIRGKGNALAVRRKPRLHIPRQPFGDPD